MKSISESIKELGNSFNLMKKVGNDLVILVDFPNEWETHDSEDGLILVDEITDESGTHKCFYSSDLSVTFEKVFDFILELKRYNIEKVQKMNIFNELVNQLRVTFEGKSLEEVLKLRIVSDEGEKKTKRKYIKKSPKFKKKDEYENSVQSSALEGTLTEETSQTEVLVDKVAAPHVVYGVEGGISTSGNDDTMLF